MGRATKEKGITDAEYARHRGCSRNTVSVARREGRIAKCLLPSGRIRNAAAADAEWAATTKADRVPMTGPTSPGTNPPADYAEARLRREAAEAEKAEIVVAKMKGELVPAAEVRAKVEARYAGVRTKLLGVPARARQQDPGLTASQLALLEALIREALEDLAMGDEEIEAVGPEKATG